MISFNELIPPEFVEWHKESNLKLFEEYPVCDEATDSLFSTLSPLVNEAETVHSSDRVVIPDTRIPESLRGYDEDDLKQLSVHILRQLCEDRGLLENPSMRINKCVRRLVEWKARRQEKKISYDLIAEGDSLIEILGKKDIHDLRSMCAERDLTIVGGYFHRHHCIDQLLIFQRDNIKALEDSKQETISPDDVRPCTRSSVQDTKTIASDSPSVVDANSVLHVDEVNFLHSIKSGRTIQARVGTTWFKGKIIRVNAAFTVARVKWGNGTHIENLDLINASPKNLRIFSDKYERAIPATAKKPFDPEFELRRAILKLEDFIQGIRKNRVAIAITSWRRLVLVHKHEAAIKLQTYMRRFLAYQMRKALIRQRIVDNSFRSDQTSSTTPAFIVSQLRVALELLTSITQNLTELEQRQSFPPELLSSQKRSSLKNGKRTMQLSVAKDILRTISEVTLAAGKLSALPFRRCTSASVTVQHDIESTCHPAAICERSIEVDRHQHLSLEGIAPLHAFIRGISNSDNSSSYDTSSTLYFISALTSSIACTALVPFPIAWLGKQVRRHVPRLIRERISKELGILPSGYHTLKEIDLLQASVSPIAMAIGTRQPPESAIGIRSQADNFERKFSGECANTTTIAERIVDIDELRYPRLHDLLKQPESRVEVPMEKTNLEYEVSSWCADSDSDTFLAYNLLALSVGMEDAIQAAPFPILQGTKDETNTFQVFGDGRRKISRQDYGLMPVEYEFDQRGCISVSNRSFGPTQNPDGKNVFSRNSCRLLRQRLQQFALGSTLDSLYKETTEAAEDLGIVASIGGDGAPIRYFINRKKQYLREMGQKVRTNYSMTSADLPTFPKSEDEMLLFLHMSDSERLEALMLPQHLTSIDETTGLHKDEANPKWLALRRVRITASAAASLLPISIRDVAPGPEFDALLLGHEREAKEKGWSLWESARPPVRAKINNSFAGNKYTAVGNEHESSAIQEALDALTSAYSDGVSIERTGIYVHKSEEWLAASNDGEVQFRNLEDLNGVIECKVTAAMAIAYWKDPKCDIPDLPWGLNTQPPSATEWEIFCDRESKFVSSPNDWPVEFKGPSKWSHFVQMNLQTFVARSYGKNYNYIYYVVWHPARLWLYRTTYSKTWTELVLVPFLRTVYFREFFLVVLDYQSTSANVEHEESSAVLSLSNEDVSDKNDDEDDPIDVEDTDLKDTSEGAFKDSSTTANIQVYNKNSLLIPGALHDLQSDLKAMSLVFETEITAIVKHSGCNEFAASTPKRLEYLINVASIKKSNCLLEEQILPGFLEFTVTEYRALTLKNVKHDPFSFLQWVIDVGSVCPCFERFRLLIRCEIAAWFKKASCKAGGNYLHRYLMEGETSEVKAAAGQDTYTDIHVYKRCERATAPPNELITAFIGSEIDCGSHIKDGDDWLEAIHEKYSRFVPENRLSLDTWLKMLQDFSSSASEKGGELNNFGSEQASTKIGAFGNIDLSSDGHSHVANWFKQKFPSLPAPHDFVDDEGSKRTPTFEWYDQEGHSHVSNEQVDISGKRLSLVELDPIRAGRMVMAKHLRETVFGQNNEMPESGVHGTADVDSSVFSFDTAFGENARLLRVCESNAAKCKREKGAAEVIAARTAETILMAYMKTRKITVLRQRLRALQDCVDRPPDSIGDARLDTNAFTSKKEEVAEALAAWIEKYPKYCEVPGGHDKCILMYDSKKSESIEKQIMRHTETKARDIEAIKKLREKCLTRTPMSSQTICGEFLHAKRHAFDELLILLKRSADTSGVVCGGRDNCILKDREFADDTVALRSLYLSLSREKDHVVSSKKLQMEELHARQEKGVLRFLRYREERARVAPNRSFWEAAVPPVGAGAQSRSKAAELRESSKSTTGVVRVRDKFSSMSDIEIADECRRQGFVSAGSRSKLLNYLRHPEKAKIARVEDNPRTWTSAELKKYLRANSKQTSGSREQLIVWALDLTNAPPAKVQKKKEASSLDIFSAPRLNAELNARSLSSRGSRSDKIRRLKDFDNQVAVAAESLQKEVNDNEPEAEKEDVASTEIKERRETQMEINDVEAVAGNSTGDKKSVSRSGRVLKKSARFN